MRFLAQIVRRIFGDYWRLETDGHRWGVWHPWRRHVWGDFRFTFEEAAKEQKRLNNELQS